MGRPLHLSNQIMLLDVFWSASYSFSLWVLEKGTSRDVKCSLGKGVAVPSPARISSSVGCWLVLCHRSRLLLFLRTDFNNLIAVVPY